MEQETQVLVCHCRVETGRDQLGRVVGTIIDRGAACSREDHLPGHVIVMPGRDHARRE